jgi:hypothetical protein
VRVLRASWSFTGPGVMAAIEALGVPQMRDRNGGAWLVRQSHGQDVLAWLELHDYRVEAQL